MADPTNISKVTATDIGTTFPYTITQDANIAGVTQDLWFTVTPLVSGLYGAYGRGTGGGYTPHTNVDDLADTFPVLGSSNTPVQYYLSAATPYWFQCENVGGDHAAASLTFSVELSADLGIRRGDLFIQDDIDGFPAIAIDPTTGTPTHAVFPFPGGEAGDALPLGAYLVEDQTNTKVALYDIALQQVAVLADGAIDTNLSICRNGGRTAFYFASHTAANTVTLKAVDPISGAILDTQTLAATVGCAKIAASPDDTILYLSGKAVNDSTISAWDLVNHTYLADFAAAVAGYAFPLVGLLCLTDGKVVAVYRNNGANPLLVRVYSSAGATLVSQTFGTTPFGSHTGYAVNDPTSFWLWINESGNTRNTYYNLLTSALTNVAPTPFTVDTFEEGVNLAASPADRFGNSGSCPLFALQADVPSQTTTYTIRRQRRFLLPSSSSQYRMSIPTLELLLRTGIGLLPDAAGSSTPLGVDPEVRLRISKDGGKTWGPERARSGGLRGEFKDRVRWTRATGNYRNGVGEVTVDAPVDWQWLAMLGDPTEGSS